MYSSTKFINKILHNHLKKECNLRGIGSTPQVLGEQQVHMAGAMTHYMRFQTVNKPLLIIKVSTVFTYW